MKVICNKIKECEGNSLRCPHAIPHQPEWSCTVPCDQARGLEECMSVVVPFEIKLPEDVFEI